MPSLRVDLLGTPVFRSNDAPVVVDTRKALAMLAVMTMALADGSGAVGRDRLAALLWPEADDARARSGLRRTLSVLVAATGDALETGRATISLRPAAVTADVVAFRTLTAPGRTTARADLAQAVGLVRGPFLAGFSVRGCAAFDDWTAETSAALGRELGEVLERLVLDRLRHGELHAALADAVRWLELDPLHEPAHRSVMRLLAWTGRRQEAIEQYRRCVRVLGDELGVAPVRATTAVFDAIRTDTLDPPRTLRARATPSAVGAVTPPAPGHRVPADPTARLPMVGRDAELETRFEAAGTPGRVLLITGENGVGRSRLVEEFSARRGPVLLARAHGGEAALSFAPVADLVRDAVARIGQLPPDVVVEMSRLLPELRPVGREPAPPLTSLGARDRFYDAVVHVLAAADVTAVVVEDVHAASTASADVLTYLLYRLDRLRCPLVLTWRDPGLPPRHPVRVALAGGRLTDRVTTLPLGRLTATEVAALAAAADLTLDVDRLMADTDGLPMLVVEAIRSGGDSLPTSARGLLAARLAEVSEETAQVLGALAVHGGVADPAVLRTTSGRGEAETVDAVEEAMRAGLVREEGAAVAFVHDALRRVAYSEVSRVRRRLLHGRAAEALVGGRDAEVRAGLIAHHFHAAGRDEPAVEWAWTAATRAAQLFAHEETLLHLETVAALGRRDAPVALANGDALVALGRYEEALVAFSRAASLTGPHDQLLQAGIARRAADVHARIGEWQLADAELASALALLSGATGRSLRAQVLADRAVVAARIGELDTARAHVAAARAEADTPYVQDVAGVVALAAGDLPGAEQAFAAALALAPDVVLEAAVLNNLARAQAAAGSTGLAVTTARAALVLGETHGDRHRLAALHANLADRLHEADEPESAMSHLKTAAALFAEVGADPLDHPDVWTLTGW